MPAFTVNMLPIIVLLSGPYVMIFVMWAFLRKRDKTLALPIDKAKLLRGPSFGVSEQLLDKKWCLFEYLIVMVMLGNLPFAIIALEAISNGNHFPLFYVLFIIIVVAFYAVKTWRLMQDLTN
ncbi:hypothetical protein [Shewanella surugensis]|uniref:SdpI family protein n=1 Tax=Shewanella surugensis TaxID=212020 RepID=A0ABT0L6E3_9GAMM|nr:hypothetical protein [Shewanella surugensis]MCL1123253.1 hypothetical protein [Shewanella surugensis]